MSTKSSNKSMINISTSKLKQLREAAKLMTLEKKRKLLIGLKKYRNETIGGETDITYADNLSVDENEFTSTTHQERNVISKTFDMKGDFDNYINQRRGIEITQKEQQAVINYAEAKPIRVDRFFIKYETTDPFGNNESTVIKKLKEENQFCWTAFSKTESANKEEEEQPEGSEKPVPTKEPGIKEIAPIPSKPSGIPKQPVIPARNNKNANITIDNTIRITKSITFIDEIEGANILADFLETLEI